MARFCYADGCRRVSWRRGRQYDGAIQASDGGDEGMNDEAMRWQLMVSFLARLLTPLANAGMKY